MSGTTASISFDQEFYNHYFVKTLQKHGMKPKPRSARRHSKIGSLKSGNFALRQIYLCIPKHEMHERDKKPTSFTVQEIISRAVLATNLPHVNNRVSSFELARGYTSSNLGLPQTLVDSEFIDANYEQIVSRTLSKILESRSPNSIPSHLLTKGKTRHLLSISSIRTVESQRMCPPAESLDY